MAIPRLRLGRLARYTSRRTVALLCALATLFAVLSLAIRAAPFQAMDLRATREVQLLHGTPIGLPLRDLSYFGDPRLMAVLPLVMGALLWRSHLRRMGVFVAATVINLPVDVLLKSFWLRERPQAPQVLVLMNRFGSSFPSGHAFAATSFYGFLAYLAWVHLPRRRVRDAATFLLGAMPPLIALSRVYVGAHWTSDVVGGMTAGLALVLVLASLYKGHARPVTVNAMVPASA